MTYKEIINNCGLLPADTKIEENGNELLIISGSFVFRFTSYESNSIEYNYKLFFNKVFKKGIEKIIEENKVRT